MNAPLRVGINLLWLVPGVVGGTEEAASGFLTELLGQPIDDVDVTLFALDAFREAHPDLSTPSNSVLLHLDGRSRLARVAAESTWLAHQARRHQIDVMHHYGGVVPAISRPPSVVTIHDVQVFEHPENFSPVKRRWLHTVLPRSVGAARFVLTPSEFARQSLIDHLGADPAKVRVAWHGVRLRQRVAPGSDEVARVRATYRLDGPVILYPAVTYPHKNHLTLLRAFALVADQQPRPTLVLSGGVATEEPQVLAEIERLGIGDQVRRVGRIPRGDLDVLMQVARILAFPSRYEGFGLPLLEAMADGAVVVAADRTAAPEVVGDAGVLLDPDDVDAWASTLALLLQDDEVCRDLIARGHARVGQFAWRNVVRSIVETYRDTVDRGGSQQEVAP